MEDFGSIAEHYSIMFALSFHSVSRDGIFETCSSSFVFYLTNEINNQMETRHLAIGMENVGFSTIRLRQSISDGNVLSSGAALSFSRHTPYLDSKFVRRIS